MRVLNGARVLCLKELKDDKGSDKLGSRVAQ